MRFIVEFLLLVNTVFAIDQLSGFNDCGLPTDHLKLEKFSISNPKPKGGETVAMYVGGTLRKPIQEGAVVKVSGQKLLIPFLLTSPVDFCSEIAPRSLLACPILPSSLRHQELQVFWEFDLPNIMAGLVFQTRIEAFNPDGSRILCLTGNMEVLRNFR